MYFCYIIYSDSLSKYYVGASSDPQGRLQRHNTANYGYTSKGRPWRIVYIEEYPDKESAYERERKIKSWKSRKMIEQLLIRKME